MTWPVHRSSSAADALLRQRGLRKRVAEDTAQAAAGGVHVALRALEAHLRREIRLGIGLRPASQQRQAVNHATSSSLKIIGTLLR